eukprot:TRINITY_DN4429_c0_g1_i3.p1 TRINITY_DN4429_c0_g1~~TRINITY_DN4429_c0_g1_i3.p1  ORF type:complete len:142 (+),score=29.62 TRINITY_DN4429_c0_g1_i3:231-656(+)
MSIQETPKFVDCAAGKEHSLLLDDKGHLFSFGDGSYGKLGLNNTNSHYQPQRVQDAMVGSSTVPLPPITKVESGMGASHSLIIDHSNQVYSFGWGGYAQLGQGDSKDYHLPKLIDFGEKVMDAKVGTWHSLILNDANMVYR